MFLISSCSCLCPTHWSQVLSREWRWSWCSADRRCSNYIWVINNFIACWGAAYVRDLKVYEWTKVNIKITSKQITPQLIFYGLNFMCILVLDVQFWATNGPSLKLHHFMRGGHKRIRLQPKCAQIQDDAISNPSICWLMASSWWSLYSKMVPFGTPSTHAVHVRGGGHKKATPVQHGLWLVQIVTARRFVHVRLGLHAKRKQVVGWRRTAKLRDYAREMLTHL